MNKVIIISLASIIYLLTSCDIDKTRSGKMPDVDVKVETEPGRLPAYDIDWAEVNVGTRTKIVKVPKVVVVMEEEEIEVPYIDVEMPTDNNKKKEERVLIAEAEVSGVMQKIEIDKVYATADNLYVVSKLIPTGEKLGDKMVRVSDRLVLNVPEDMDIRHYIVGKKGNADFNNQYRYITNISELKDRVNNTKLIYTR